MINKSSKSICKLIVFSGIILLSSCGDKAKKATIDAKNKIDDVVTTTYPSDVIPFFDKFKILLGDGAKSKNLVNYKARGYLKNFK